MRIYKRPPKPVSYEPSKYLQKYADHIIYSDLPIVDVACGYGRNGAYVANLNHKVIFADIDQDCLDFIEEGKGFNELKTILPENKMVYKADLLVHWPFLKESLGGIICVHFYTHDIISKCLESIGKGGFFYFETISARSGNIASLPRRNEIYNLIKDRFEILFYSEKQTPSPDRNTCIVFAIKKT